MVPTKPTKKTDANSLGESAKQTHAPVKRALRKPSTKEAVAITVPLESQPEAIQEDKDTASERYWEAVGRRKTAIARVRLFTKGDKGIWVDAKSLAEYFHNPTLERIAAEALETMKSTDRFRASVRVKGGGIHAQAEAIRHGSARALVLFNPDFRKRLKRAGFLTRDPRMTERKKFGLKKARRAPQWAKR